MTNAQQIIKDLLDTCELNLDELDHETKKTIKKARDFLQKEAFEFFEIWSFDGDSLVRPDEPDLFIDIGQAECALGHTKEEKPDTISVLMSLTATQQQLEKK